MEGVVESKLWRCPECKRTKYWESELIMKVCYSCQCEMEVLG